MIYHNERTIKWDEYYTTWLFHGTQVQKDSAWNRVECMNGINEAMTMRLSNKASRNVKLNVTKGNYISNEMIPSIREYYMTI